MHELVHKHIIKLELDLFETKLGFEFGFFAKQININNLFFRVKFKLFINNLVHSQS